MSFAYDSCKLAQDSSSIRLLKLHHGSPEDPIRCSFKVVSFDERPSYIAISYTWEPENPKTAILLEGKNLTIGYNVSTLLKEFRDPHQDLWLWIDAICINQTNQHEKQEQIKLMANIYKAASQTWVWLGEAADNSGLAMGFLKQFEATQLKSLETDPDGEPWKSLRLLLRRRWWSRLWVLQEAMLSKEVTVCCGSDRVPFGQFVVLRQCEKEHLIELTRRFGGLQLFNTGVPMEGALLSWDLDRYRIEIGRMRLHEWFSYAMFFDCSVEHDRIYGLLGLIGEAERAKILINYDMPIRTLFTRVAFETLKQRGLEALHVGFVKRNKGLPSWVPDWTTSELITYLDVWVSDRSSGGGDNRGWDISTLASWTWNRICNIATWKTWELPDIDYKAADGTLAISLRRELLAVKAIIFDTIEFASPNPFEELYGGTDLLEYERYRERREDSTVKSCLAWEKHVNSLEPDPYRATCGRYEAFWRTLITDRDFNWKGGASLASWAKLFEIWMRRSGPQDSKERKQLMFDYYCLAVTRSINRSFITTKLGYMGLAPARSQIGDVVCVIKGGKVPFVLRESPGGLYQFVGETYVHGIMDGEVEGLHKEIHIA